MTLLETWRNRAYGDGLDNNTQEKLWQDYFITEKGIYEKILSAPLEVIEGSVRELADRFGTDIQTMTGFLDGINESLKGYENPIETMDEDTVVKIQIDPEKLYYNMVDAKASWLYELPQWDSLISEEKRKELYHECKIAGTVKREEKKVYPNDPCPCGSGKKYKKCCGKNA
ncbi:MAG: SEC-C metal-binding domain-containing protein [Eubacteriales bacterium]|nr:SEC-C metal-binding domain-containing protein [Eubacteriales bacterium]